MSQRCTGRVEWAFVSWLCERRAGHEGEHWIHPIETINSPPVSHPDERIDSMSSNEHPVSRPVREAPESHYVTDKDGVRRYVGRVVTLVEPPAGSTPPPIAPAVEDDFELGAACSREDPECEACT